MIMDSDPADVFKHLEETPLLRERIRHRLELLIISGGLPPGTRLAEGELAAMLGVSRGPIREALQLLWRDGFVDLRPRQGALVHVPTQREIDDFFDIRRALERESVRLAALRVTPNDARRLNELLELARGMLDKGDDPSAVHRHVKIHREFARIADNAILSELLGNIQKQSHWYKAPYEPTGRRRAWAEHEVIVAAITAGDPRAAMSAIELHVDDVKQHLYEAIWMRGIRTRGIRPGSL